MAHIYLPIFFSSSLSNKLKLKSIEQWGDKSWNNLENAFSDCANMVNNATDVPDISSAHDMTGMFQGATSFNGDLSGWDVSNVTDMTSLFQGASSFNGDVSTWDVSQVKWMTKMFRDASNFDGDVTSWDVEEVKSMEGMFRDATSFNRDLSNWNVSKVDDFETMFSGATSFNGNIFDLTATTSINLKYMFNKASSFNQSLANWNMENVTAVYKMLYESGLDLENYDNTLIGWSIQNLHPNLDLEPKDLKYCNSVFARDALMSTPHNWTISGDIYECPIITNFVTTWETTSIDETITIPTIGIGYNYTVDWGDGNIDNGVTGNISHIYATPNTHTITISGDFPRIFFNNTGDKLKIKSVENWGDIQWTSMANAFLGASNLVINAPNAPDLSLASDLSSMFEGASSLNNDFLNWDLSTVSNLNSMFKGATIFDGNISNWEVANVNTMDSMFQEAINFSGDVSLWNVDQVISMESTFKNATKFNSHLDNWNVNNVVSFSGMFWNATSFNGNIFTINNNSAANDLSHMFDNAAAFNNNLEGWDITNITDISYMLRLSGINQINYDDILSEWASQSIQPNLTLHADGLLFCNNEDDRNVLISAPNNWTISGDNLGCPELPFVTSWEVTSMEPSVTIPTAGTGYDYTIDWGDGTIETNQTGNATHTYTSSGIYSISISGDFPRIYMGGNYPDELKIISIDQWGTIEWNQMSYAFLGAANLQLNALDSPDLSNVAKAIGMFKGATSFNADLSSWDVSNITRMNSMFEDATNFNGDISNWDVSNATRMNSMFEGASSFNGNITNWDVSKVTRMDRMFYSASSFNQTLNWDMSKVTQMESMFAGANTFNSDVSNWDVSNVSDFSAVFASCDNFNQDISSWQFSSVLDLDFSFMFYNSKNFNQYLGGWDMSNVIDAEAMLSLSGLDLMNYDNTLIGWESQDLPMNINFGAIGLEYCNAEEEHNALTMAPNNWQIMGDYFGCEPIEDRFIMTWETTSPNENIKLPVYGNAYHVDWGDGDISINLSNSTIHSYDIAGIYTIEVFGDFSSISFQGELESNSAKIKSIEQCGTNQWPDMDNNFIDCINLVINAIDAPDLSNATRLIGMFRGASSVNSDFSNWDVSTITIMTSMFNGASNFNGDISNWDVSNVALMNRLFKGASNFNGDISGWNTSKVRDTKEMFMDATDFNVDLSTWDMAKVTTFERMFRNATNFNGNIFDINAPSVGENFEYMFYNATSFNQDLGNWDISSATNMNNMLSFSGLDLTNYDNTLIGWANQTVIPNLTLGADDLIYCNAETDRNILTGSPNNWTISGDLLDCSNSDSNNNYNETANRSASQLSTFNLFPNPSLNFFDISLEDNAHINYTVKVFNSVGKLVSYKIFDKDRSEKRFSHQLPAGIYTIQITDNIITHSKKLIISPH